MEHMILFSIALLCGALFTGIGIFAWRRKKPMWFWSGSPVRKEDLSDVPAYNRANGKMWLVFSAAFWGSAGLRLLN